MEEQKADSAAVHLRSQTDHTQRSPGQAQTAYAALNARSRTVCREFSSNSTELTSKSVANYSDVA